MDKKYVGIDKKKEKRVDATDRVTPLVSRKTLSIVKWISIVVFAVVFILSARGLYVCFLERIQTWVNTLAIIFAAYVGGAYIIDTSKRMVRKLERNYIRSQIAHVHLLKR